MRQAERLLREAIENPDCEVMEGDLYFVVIDRDRGFMWRVRKLRKGLVDFEGLHRR